MARSLQLAAKSTVLKEKTAVKLVLFALLVTFSTQAFAASVAYRPIELVKQDPKRGNRAEWDQTGRFCYKFAGTTETYCAAIIQLGEVKVRENGAFSNDPKDQAYISQLSPQALAAASKFDKLYVRYIGLEDGERFVAHMFTGKQTLFAFGQLVMGHRFIGFMESFSYSPDDFNGMLLNGLIQAGADPAGVQKIIADTAADLIVAEEIAAIHMNMKNEGVNVGNQR